MPRTAQAGKVDEQRRKPLAPAVHQTARSALGVIGRICCSIFHIFGGDSMSFSPFLREFAEALAEALAGMFPGGKVVLKRSGLLNSTKSSLDERLRKIEVAKTNLEDALEAIDELKNEAKRNQDALTQLTKKLDEREREKGALDAKLVELRTLSDVSASTMQQVFRIPTRASVWAERAIGFGIGVGASIAASMIYARLP